MKCPLNQKIKFNNSFDKSGRRFKMSQWRISSSCKDRGSQFWQKPVTPAGSVSAGVAARLCFVLKEESGEQVNLSSLSPAQDLDSGHWAELSSTNLRLTNSIISHYYYNNNLPSIWLLFKHRHREPPNIFPSQVCFYKKLWNKTIHQLCLSCVFPCLAQSIINSKMRGEGVVVVGRQSNLFVITSEDTISWL